MLQGACSSMALSLWGSVVETVADALSGWGAHFVVEDEHLQELRDFGMDFELDSVEALSQVWPEPGYDDLVTSRYPALVNRLRADPATRQAVIQFPPNAAGEFPSLLQVSFALRHGALEMTLIARTTRFPDQFAALGGPCLHLQERLAGALDVQRGRCTYFCLQLYRTLD